MMSVEMERQSVRALSRNAALLVVDMQMGFDAPAWGHRNNPNAETKVAALLAAWRAAASTVIHIHHDSPSPTGLLRRGSPGNSPKPEAQPLAHEKIYRKRVNSAFIGTDLEVDLVQQGVATLAIVGLTTNHCISTTARMSGNLGFETFVLRDATAAFARPDLNGRNCPADEVHNAALSDLRGEFAQIVDTNFVLAALAERRAACV